MEFQTTQHNRKQDLSSLAAMGWLMTLGSSLRQSVWIAMAIALSLSPLPAVATSVTPALNSESATTPDPLLSQSAESLPNLEVGDRRDAVRLLRVALAEAGYYREPIAENVEGINLFTPALAQAVTVFQQETGLPPTGRVDQSVWRILRGEMTDADIQRRLAILGYYQGIVSGQENLEQQRAIARFRSVNNLEALREQSIRLALFQADARPAPRDLFLGDPLGLDVDPFDVSGLETLGSPVSELDEPEDADSLALDEDERARLEQEIREELAQEQLEREQLEEEIREQLALEQREQERLEQEIQEIRDQDEPVSDEVMSDDSQPMPSLSPQLSIMGVPQPLLPTIEVPLRIPVEELSQGDRNSQVAYLQAALAYYGYDSGAIDGEFDDAVRIAVVRFQDDNELRQDGRGVVGQQTRNVLLNPSRTDLQRRLSILGYYTEAINGLNSEAYRDALETFRRRNGLRSPQTMQDEAQLVRLLLSPQALVSEELAEAAIADLIPLDTEDVTEDAPEDAAIEDATEPSDDPDPETGSNFPSPAFDPLGESSSPEPLDPFVSVTPAPMRSIQAVQQQLQVLGYYRGAIDNQLDEELRLAITAFQSRNELNPTGQLNAQTRSAIFAPMAIAAETVTPQASIPDSLESQNALDPQGTSPLEPFAQGRRYTITPPPGGRTTSLSVQSPSGTLTTQSTGEPLLPLATGGTAAANEVTTLSQLDAIATVRPITPAELQELAIISPQLANQYPTQEILSLVGSRREIRVLDLQQRLQAERFYTRELTGVFDTHTRNAVLAARDFFIITIEEVLMGDF